MNGTDSSMIQTEWLGLASQHNGRFLNKNLVYDDTEMVRLTFTNNINIHAQMVEQVLKLVNEKNLIQQPESWSTELFSKFPVNTYARYSRNVIGADDKNTTDDENNTLVNFFSVIILHEEDTLTPTTINGSILNCIDYLKRNKKIYGERKVNSLIKKLKSTICTINIEDIKILIDSYVMEQKIVNMLTFLLENYITIFTSFMHRIIFNIIIPSKLMIGGNLISTDDYTLHIHNLYPYSEATDTFLSVSSISSFMKLLKRYTSPSYLLCFKPIIVHDVFNNIKNESYMNFVTNFINATTEYVLFPCTDLKTWQLIVVDKNNKKIIGYDFNDKHDKLLENVRHIYIKFFGTIPDNNLCVIHSINLDNPIYNSGICMLMFIDLIAYATISVIENPNIIFDFSDVAKYRAKVCLSLLQHKYYTLLPNPDIYEIPICSKCNHAVEGKGEDSILHDGECFNCIEANSNAPGVSSSSNDKKAKKSSLSKKKSDNVTTDNVITPSRQSNRNKSKNSSNV